MIEHAPLSPINGPSDIEDGSDADLEAVALAPPKAAEKRGPRPASHDRTQVRASLARSCPCKGKNCFEQFTSKDGFESLMKFRTEMHELHKLDQDRVDTQFQIQTQIFWR